MMTETPYFGLVVFCGPWYPKEYDDGDNYFPRILHPFNFIHLTEAEMDRGYRAYYCLAKVKDLHLKNVLGYFVMADDTVFNFWNGINMQLPLHPTGYDFSSIRGWWITGDIPGRNATVAAKELFTQVYKNITWVQTVWQQYQKGVS
ncbi:unnamed protein product [Strongylus vulgaris]|uniref:Uncharacterized protein n=1 Tax=Strongylus vulgaris TaxID=40348 RepID=A0A3P7JST6_STRVU|nr:unnamed protein product [Strongylus vulgaris]